MSQVCKIWSRNRYPCWTYSGCRFSKEIWKTAEEYGLPVISCGNKGFCLAETDEEMKEFNDNRDKRVAGIRKTQELANKNYEEWKKKK